MLDAPPAESEKTSWAFVAIGVLVIYATIPVARSLRNAVDSEIGRGAFLLVAAVLLLVAAILALRSLRRRRLPRSAWVWLCAILSLFAIYIYRLRDIPEEALHVAEYGALGVLVYRALAQRMRDHGIYLAAAMIVGMVGIVDEYIQWLVPDRVFDLRDIRTNFISGALAQLAILAGLRPALIAGAPDAASGSRLCYIAATALALLAIAFQNTPDRVARYAAQQSWLSFLLDGRSHMADYGYLYQDPDTGIFRSRFTREELDRLDRQRGAEVAAILDRYIRGEGYRQFLRNHSVIRDPYAHEAGVHLFRREVYFDRARAQPQEQGEYFAIAHRENRILEKYFGSAIGLSRHRWSEATRREAAANADMSLAYDSAVSQDLITAMSARQTLLFFVAAIAALLGTGWRLRRLHGPVRPA